MQYIGKEAVASLGKSEQVGIFKDSNIGQFLTPSISEVTISKPVLSL